MWFSGIATLQRAREFNFKHLGPKGRAVWDRAPTAPYGFGPLKIDPHMFAYAAARSSIVGKKLGLRGQIAGLGLASAALSYLKKPPSGELFLHHNFPLLKDFVGTSLTGTIGAAIAYLEMLDLGYVWHGHWEDCVKSGSVAAHPDFIFAKPSAICLVDAKGTTTSADSTAKQEWHRQIYKNRAVQMKFGGTANEGRVIATVLSATDPGVLVTAYGNWLAKGQQGAKTTSHPKAISSVQRANFIDAFFLVGLANLAWKLVGSNNPGPLDQGSTRLLSIRGEQVYVGPIRLTLTIDDEQWVMQPFCRKTIVDEVIRCIGNDEGFPMQSAVREGGLKITHLDNLSATFIDGPDGVGAIFHLVKSAPFFVKREQS